MTTHPFPSFIEALEARIAPATLDFNAGVLTYTAAAGEVNDVHLEYQDAGAGTDVITDDGETALGNGVAIPITLTQAAIDAGFVLSTGNTVATGPHAASTSIIFNLGDAADTMHLDSSNTNVTIDGGAGSNTIISGKLADQLHPVIVKATGGSNALTLDDSTSTATGATFTLGIGKVTANSAFGGPSGGLTYSDTTSLLLKCSPQADTVNVEFTRAATLVTIQSGDGADTVNVAGISKTLQEIVSKLTVDLGPGANILNLHDESSTASSVTLTSQLVDRGAGTVVDIANLNGTLHYFASTTASGASTPLVSVPSVDVGTTIAPHFAGSTAPLVQVAGASNDLDNIAGEVDVTSTATFGSVFLHDSANPNGHSYVFTDGVMTRDGHTLFAQTGLKGVTLTGAIGGSLLDGSASSVRLNLSGNSGDDLILPSHHGDTVFHGGGIDSLEFSGLAGDTTITDSTVVAPGFTTIIADPTLGGSAFAVTKIGGDAGVNKIDASAYTGYALLDGAGGKDTLLGAEAMIAGKTMTYRDALGDPATVKTSKGKFSVVNFDFIPRGQGTADLAFIDLSDAAFTGAGLTISAKAPPKTTGHFVNVGALIANQVNLGAVTIGGDLGALFVGSGDAKVNALSSLTVQSIGALGTTTQFSGATNDSNINGRLGALTVKDAFSTANLTIFGNAAGSALGKLTVGGNLSGLLVTQGSIGAVRLGSTSAGAGIAAGSGNIGAITIDHHADGLALASQGLLGAVKIGGDLTSSQITAAGTPTPKNAAAAVAIKSLTVAGKVDASRILAGYDPSGAVNPDASIGAVTVGKDWSASSLVAGAETTTTFGGGLDTVITAVAGPFAGLLGGDPATAATIASITIKGTATGSANAMETFGIVAQKIGTVKIGPNKQTIAPAPSSTALGTSGNFNLVLLA